MTRFGAIGSISLILAAQAASGQNATTSVRGVVQDSTGAAIPGASVTLVDPAAGRTLKTTANAQGEYELLQLTPARYTITATAPGFGTSIKQAELLVNQPATLNFAGAANIEHQHRSARLGTFKQASPLRPPWLSEGHTRRNATVSRPARGFAAGG